MKTDPSDLVVGGRRSALKAIAAGGVILARGTFAAPPTTADSGLLRRRIPSSGGVTHYHASAYPELEALLRSERPDFVQFNYSMAEREAERRLLPLAQELGIAVIINRPFAKASLFSRVRSKPLPEWAADFDCASWAQFFLKFILAQPAVTCTIPATSKLQHLQDNLAAGRGRLPDAQQRSRMIEYLARI